MKKVISLVLIICFLVTGCGAAGTGTEEKSATTETTEVNTENIGELEVHFIDVGQGDATLLKCDGESMIIDAGDNSKGTAIQSYLSSQKVESLKYLIVTHAHEDHCGGADVIVTKFDCQTIIMPEHECDTTTYQDVLSSIEYKSYKNTAPVVGNTYELGSAKFTILAPNNYNYGDNENDYSVSILVEHGNKKFIFTGDAEEAAEADILKNGINISADVYQAGHHGSNTASSEEFLDAVNPTYTVISCGEGNSYGHPHAKTLNNLRARNVKVFRTDEQGTIVAKSDGNEITWNCSQSETWKVGESTQNNSEKIKKETVKEDTDTKTAQEEDIKNVTYILNANSKKYHLPSCESVSDISEKNKEESNLSKAELEEQGYESCKRCNP